MKSQVVESVTVWQNIQAAAKEKQPPASVKEYPITDEQARKLAHQFARKMLHDCRTAQAAVDRCGDDDSQAAAVRASLDLTLCPIRRGNAGPLCVVFAAAFCAAAAAPQLFPMSCGSDDLLPNLAHWYSRTVRLLRSFDIPYYSPEYYDGTEVTPVLSNNLGVTRSIKNSNEVSRGPAT